LRQPCGGRTSWSDWLHRRDGYRRISPDSIYNSVVDVLLVGTAWRTAKSARLAASIDERTRAHPLLLPSIVAGTIVGFVSGVTGIGGGILRFATGTHFARANHAACGGAIINFLNSGAALAGFADHAASITDLACGGRRGRNSWFMVGREASAGRTAACNLSAFSLAAASELNDELAISYGIRSGWGSFGGHGRGL
jgi:hypothetical protein